MANLIVLRALERLRKVIGMCPLDLTRWGLLVTIADLVEWLGRGQVGVTKNCLMAKQSKKNRVCVDMFFEKFC